MHGELTAYQYPIFLVKDGVDKGEVYIKYCPFEHIIADNFTKPLQGKLFCVLREVIIGHEQISWLLEVLPSIKESYENLNKSMMVAVKSEGKKKVKRLRLLPK